MNYKFEQKLTNKVLFILFFLSVSIQAWTYFSHHRVGSDQMIQIGTAVGFLDEGKFNLEFARNIECDIEKRKIFEWPYFERILAVPILILTNKNPETTYLILKTVSFAFILFSLIFFLSTIYIARKRLLIALLIVFSSFALAPFKSLGDSDMFAVGFTFLALSFFLKHFQESKNNKWIILFFLTIAILPQIRYAFIPASITLLGLYIITSFIHKKSFKIMHLIFISIPFLSLISIVSNSYFIKQSARNTAVIEIIKVDESIWWMKSFYAVFFNAFIPDYIIISFTQKFKVFYENSALFIFASFSLISIIILIYILYYYFKKQSSILKLFNYEKLPETILMIVLFSDLLFYIFLGRNSSGSLKELYSETIVYGKLAVMNRYFGLMHFLILFLSIIFIFKYKSKLFKGFIYTSIFFGTLHFFYLRTVYHPFDRKYNMNIVNSPAGSYYDIQQIGEILRYEKKQKKVYFAHDFGSSIEEENFRQITPRLIAMANHVVLLNSLDGLNKEITKYNSIYYSSMGNNLNQDWELVYKGNVYHLFKYLPNAPK
jgi:hypothetical protein